MPDTAHAYDHVRGIYFPIAIGVFVLVVGTLLVFVVLGARRRRADASHSEAPRVELLYALGLALVVAFLLVVTFRAESPIDRAVADPRLRIEVTAAQWSWHFSYPNGAQVDAVSTWHPSPAYVPTGTEVEFFGRSRDVIHGFWVPQLHFQRQFLPGYTTRFDLRFEEPGRYGGECSVFCGDQHSEMHFAIQAVSPQRFERWLNEHAATTPGTGAKAGVTP